MAKAKKAAQDEYEAEDAPAEEGFDDFSGTAEEGDDIKYQIGKIVVDDGSSDDYTEIDDDSAVAPAASAADDDAAVVDDDDEDDTDVFLEEANTDLDDPENWIK